MSEYFSITREQLERWCTGRISLSHLEEIRAVLAQEAGHVEEPLGMVERKVEGRRERFQKWVLATKHPVLGFLDGHWLERGDDREGYANEYVQGLWVAFKEFTSPPAPVAAILDLLENPTIEMQEAGSGAADYNLSQVGATKVWKAMANMGLVALERGKVRS